MAVVAEAVIHSMYDRLCSGYRLLKWQVLSYLLFDRRPAGKVLVVSIVPAHFVYSCRVSPCFLSCHTVQGVLSWAVPIQLN